MGRRSAQLLVLAAAVLLAAGCSWVDPVEWESTGYAVDAAAHALEEEHHVEDPAIECIQREAAKLLWECRATAGEEHYHCMLHYGIRQKLNEVHCEREHEEESGEEAPHDEEASAEE